MPRLRSFCLLSLFALLSGTLLFGQRDLGTVTGTVTDPQGGAVPNATVTLVEDATGLSYQVTTGGDGTYTRPLLKPGTYTVTVQSTGFQRAEQKGVIVIAGDRVGVNIVMQVGDVNQTVEVSAAAPLLQTESSTQGADLNSTQMSQLPLGGQRTFSFLARLSPGVLPPEPGARDSLGGGFSANGVRSTGSNNFLLNGVDNNVNVIDFINQTSFVINPSVEAIGEMRILTNGYNAEYGRAAGGVLDVHLKSGTNEIHGVAFEILQNEKLNANRWENNQAGTGRVPFKQNQFGGALGGPIIKNRLFLFGNYQGTRIATAGGTVANLGYGGFYTIPSLAMRQGDFSQLLGGSVGTDPATGVNVVQNQIFDPRSTACLSACGTSSAVYTRTPFPNNVIPVSLLDPASVRIASLYPAPNQPMAPGNYPQNNFFTATPGGLNTDQGDARVDYRINDNNSLFGSVSWADTYKTSTPPFQGILDGGIFNGSSETDLGRNGQLGYTRVWTPAIISETRVGYSRLVTSRTQANANVNAFAQAGIGGYNPTGSTAQNGGLPQIYFNTTTSNGRYSQIGANDWLPTQEYSNVWDFIQNVAITTGSHSLKFGAEFRPIKFPFFQVPFPHGEMNFARTETSFPSNARDVGGQNGTFTTDTGDEMASFLLGSINNGQISSTNFISSIKNAWAFYAQDDWKVSPTLTLNLGVRYEIFSPIGERFGRQSNFVYDSLTLQIPSGKDQNTPLPPNFSAPFTDPNTGVTFPALFPNVAVCRGCVDKWLIPTDHTNVGPRVGLAWSVRPTTVLRAAYGIFYSGEENQGGNPNRGESTPFNSSPQMQRPSGVSTFAPNPFFAGGLATGGVSTGYPLNVLTTLPVTSLQFRSVAQNFRNPMVQKWNFTVQHQLPGQMGLELGYQGNKQSHSLLQPDFNACRNFGTLDPSINCNSLRRYPNIGSISGTATFGYGNYHALTAQLTKRMSAGLQFIGAYTWGHAFANSGTTLSSSTGYYTRDLTDFSKNYSNASWDIRHNFTLGLNYDLPFGRGRQFGSNWSGPLNLIAGGWQANALASFRTGNPYTIRATGCQGVFQGGCSPDVVPHVNPDQEPARGRNPSQWFNTANFRAPSPLTQGSLGLQTNTAPPTRTVDFSLFKNFAITERWLVQFRAESFNIGNTPQFGVPVNTLGQAKFGQITSTQTGSERHLQFQLRLQF
jgi:hypothetical protein